MISEKKTKIVLAESFEYIDNAVLPVNDEDLLLLSKKVMINGILYHKNMMILLGGGVDLYHFGKIIGVVYIKQSLYLYGTKCTSSHFNQHYHGYVVNFTDIPFNVHIDHLQSPFPLNFYTIDGEHIVQIKHLV